MFGKRIRYLAVLAGLIAYYFASGEWLSWILLLSWAGLPWLSLLLTLPAIVRFSVSPTGAEVMEMEEKGRLWLLGSCDLPLPPFQGTIRLTSIYTGHEAPYRTEKGLKPMHCGALTASVERAWIYDYMGIFSFRVRRTKDTVLRVRPRPVAMDHVAMPESISAVSWKPKHGGGYSENHELREYRPGDNLNQVHWKLSAKTGDLILREPMEAVSSTVLLTMTLSGTPEELDRKLGRLLWLGRKLLEEKHRFTLRVLTGQGVLSLQVRDRKELLRGIDTLLCTPLAQSGSIQDECYDAGWHCHIGGQPDEA